MHYLSFTDVEIGSAHSHLHLSAVAFSRRMKLLGWAVAKNEKEEKGREERLQQQAGTARDPAELLDPTSDMNFLHHIATSLHHTY